MGETVSIGEFRRLDIRVGTVVEVGRIPGSKSLYRMRVDLGGEVRQIVAGLVGYYTEEELMGKRIVVIRNLKPAKIFGVLSNGMLLAAEHGEELALLTVDRDIPNGARVT